MNISYFILVFCLVFVFVDFGHCDETQTAKTSRVEILTDSNFDDITSNGKWLVELCVILTLLGLMIEQLCALVRILQKTSTCL